MTAQITDLLDALLQPRFQKDAGVFGTRRVVASPGHDALDALTNVSASDKQQLARIRALKHDYRVGLLRVQHAPGTFLDAQGKPKTASAKAVPDRVAKAKPKVVPHLFPLIGAPLNGGLQVRLQGVALASLPQLDREESASGTAGDWVVTLRPVKAVRPSCLNCHRGAKKGDTLGVLVYAVNKLPLRAEGKRK